MNTERPHSSHPEYRQSPAEDSENTAERSNQQLDTLLNNAEAVFSGIGEQVKSIGDTHLQRHDEVVARDEVRMRSLQILRKTVGECMEEGRMDRAVSDRLQELEEQARTGHRLVASKTEYLYTPDSATNTASGLVQNRGMLEHEARGYVADEPRNQDDLPDSFFEGLKNINEATHQLDDMGEKLGRMHVNDTHLQESFSALRLKLDHLSLSYDESTMSSLLRTVNETIANAEDSDRSRDGVHKIAGELRKVADTLVDTADQLSRSRR